jgi:amino acid transporter
MADLEFEGRLDRLFAEAPALGDAEAFARRVQSRLDRSWVLRRGLIGGLGVVGGLIAVGQVAASGVLDRAKIISTQSSRVMSIALSNHLPAHLFSDVMPMGGDFMWALGALGVVALALFVIRTIGEL